MNPIAQPSALTSFSPSIKGAVEILNQGLEFLLTISDSDYLTRAKPHVTSSIGEHTRHTLDLFHALILKENATVDYNTRRRGHQVEYDRSIAVKEIHYVINWLERLDRNDLEAPIMIQTEVSMDAQVFASLPSTLEREVTFAALHANHHYAMIKVITTYLDIETCNTFGYAPTTSSYLREQ
ncbi:DinB family protein [Vibrio crassostreae]|nr:DinB family protein [Vibrio crassostreae]CAK2976588.1 DinB family protein [Vibrio crassostreae]CAK2976775.1 DinB family protein [Vibrio crassostreae]CAK2977684.1 DinB family protein [Vibrio crassostreae]CAK2980393.1 DinB family protein [Vibrio crassostreae]